MLRKQLITRLLICSTLLMTPMAYAASDVSVSAVAKSAVFNGDRYGPIGIGEGLWNAARAISTRYPDASVYQVMLALYKKNPLAFQENHIDLLSRGAYLDVPDKKTVMRVKTDNARRRVKAMMAALPKQTSDLPPVESRVVLASEERADLQTASDASTNRADTQRVSKQAAKKLHPPMMLAATEEFIPSPETARSIDETLESEFLVKNETEYSAAAIGGSIRESQSPSGSTEKHEGLARIYDSIAALTDGSGVQVWNLVLIGSLLLFSLGFLVLRRKHPDDDGWTTITEYVDPNSAAAASPLSERLASEMSLRLDIAHAYNELSRFRDTECILEPVLDMGTPANKVAAQELINQLPGKFS